MKKIVVILFIAAIAVVISFIFLDVFESTTRVKVKNVEIEAVVVQAPLSEKDIFLNNQSQKIKNLVLKIDSVEVDIIPSRCVHDKLSVKKDGDAWRISAPYKRDWQEVVYEGDGDETKRVFKFKSQLGNAYLKAIHKKDVWIDFNYREDFYEKSFLMEYGVLLSPDTVNGKIFPTGTFVVSRFQKESDYETGKVFHEYIEGFNSFNDRLLNLVEEVYSWPEWVNGYDLFAVKVW